MAVQAQYPSNVLLLNRYIQILFPPFSTTYCFQILMGLGFLVLVLETVKKDMIIHYSHSQGVFLTRLIWCSTII